MSSNPFDVDSNASASRNPYQTPLETSFATPTIATDHVELAGRLHRLGAVFLDGIISGVITLPIMWATGYLARAATDSISFMEFVLQAVLGMVIFLVIQGYFLANRGQTLGKMAAGIRIVSAVDGSLVPFSKLIALRYLPLWVLSSIPLIGILGLVNALFIFRQDRRCIHDLLAGTKVVNV